MRKKVINNQTTYREAAAVRSFMCEYKDAVLYGQKFPYGLTEKQASDVYTKAKMEKIWGLIKDARLAAEYEAFAPMSKALV